ncbi:MAG TPA: rhomboid family intramembrane serine protease [Chthoniobacterales bacterium]
MAFSALIRGLPPRLPVVTYGVAILSVLVFVGEALNRHAVFALLVNPVRDLPEAGWWAILATTVVHGSVAHLAFNLLAFRALGAVVEQTIGPIRYFVLLLALAWVSSSYQLGLERVVGIGLSGVIYGIFGYMLGACPRDPTFRWYVRQNYKVVIGWAVVCVVLTQMKILGIANTAHFSGLFFGALCGLTEGLPRWRWVFRALALAAMVAAVPMIWAAAAG